MKLTFATLLAVALAAAIVPHGAPPAEAAKKKSKSKAPSPIPIFSELAGINTEVEPVESRSRRRKPKGARR